MAEKPYIIPYESEEIARSQDRESDKIRKLLKLREKND